METISNLTLVLLPILYTLLMMGYARIFTRGPGGLSLFIRPVLLITVAVHAISIGVRGFLIGSCPLGSPAEYMTIIAFSVTVIYLVMEVRKGAQPTGVFAITPAFLLQIVSTVVILGLPEGPRVRVGSLDAVHVLSAVIGYSATLVSSVYALLYLFLYLAIKRGNFGLYYKQIPPLDALADLNFLASRMVFFALTIPMAMALWGSVTEGYQSPLTLSQVCMTGVLWILYGGFLVAKRFLDFGGKRLAYLSLLGLVVLAGMVAGSLGGAG